MPADPLAQALVRKTPRLLAIAGVEGAGIGRRRDGTACVVVLVDARRAGLPAEVAAVLGDLPVRIKVVGRLDARGPGSGAGGR